MHNKHIGLTMIMLAFAASVFSQSLKTVSRKDTYRQQVLLDSAQRMVELKALIPTLAYDLRYGSTNNFMKRRLYKQTTNTFLRIKVAEALARVAEPLKSKGLGLKVFDAYRPYKVTKKMWELIRDERYVADPSKGSGHNRGISIDLTLIELATGKELPMGTGFDNFSDTAHHNFQQLPAAILKNRQLLRSAMEKVGFKALETEWWHYSWPNDRGYDVLDLSFKTLRQVKL